MNLLKIIVTMISSQSTFQVILIKEKSLFFLIKQRH